MNNVIPFRAPQEEEPASPPDAVLVWDEEWTRDEALAYIAERLGRAPNGYLSAIAYLMDDD